MRKDKSPQKPNKDIIANIVIHPNNRTIKFELVDSSKYQFKDQLFTLLALDKLYRHYGGSGFKINEIIKHYAEFRPESPYEQLTDPQFAEGEYVYVEDPLSVDISRTEVYGTVIEYAKPRKAIRIINELNRRFPKKVWGRNLPLIGACQTLLNHRKDLERIVKNHWS